MNEEELQEYNAMQNYYQDRLTEAVHLKGCNKFTELHQEGFFLSYLYVGG